MKEIFKHGLWDNNPGLVQLLGLCPLLAVTSTTTNGIGLGIATTITLLISNVLVSLSRNVLPNEIRIPAFVLIIAGAVTVIELIMQAWFYELYLILGIFIPLIVTNCAILARAEAFAAKNNVVDSLADALAMGLGFTLVLMALGAMREILGFGTIFKQANLMFGEFGSYLQTTIVPDYSGFLLAILPPGAFLGLGLMLAIKNLVDERVAKRVPQIKIGRASCRERV